MPRVSDVDSIAPENTAPPVLSPAPIVETTASPVANFNLNDKVYEI